MILRYLFVLISVGIYYLLGSSVFPSLDFMAVYPNMLLAFTVSYAFRRGTTRGLFIGAFAGIIFDIMSGSLFGFYTAIFAIYGYICGLLGNNLNPEDIRYPLVFALSGDLFLNLLIYLLWFAISSEGSFLSYFISIIAPECILTTIACMIISPITGWCHQRLDDYEKRRAVKFG